MDISYIAEAEAVIIPLNLLLYIYLNRVYVKSAGANRQFMRLASASLICCIIDVLYGVLTFPACPLQVRCFLSITDQFAVTYTIYRLVCYACSKGGQEMRRRKILYFQRVVMGSYLYFQMAGFFTGANFTVRPDGTLATGALHPVLTYGYALYFIIWGLLTVFLYRAAYTKSALASLGIAIGATLVCCLVQSFLFPHVPLIFPAISASVYLFFFALESACGKDSASTAELPRKNACEGFARTVGECEALLQNTAGGADADTAEDAAEFVCPDAKVLVVDDTPVNLVVAKGMLESTRAQINTAASGEECLALLRKTAYDIVLLDHQMSGIDGVETLRRAKRMPENASGRAAYIALTANTGAGAKEEYLDAGFDDYLPKPMKSEALLRILRKYLSKKKPGKSG